MKKVLVILTVLFACKSEKPEPMQAPATTTEVSSSPYTIGDEDVPVAPDFEEAALKAITPENVEAEVAKMEKMLD